MDERKAKEYETYKGDLVNLYLKDMLVVHANDSGEQSMTGVVRGYLIEVSNGFIRLNNIPSNEYSMSIDIEMVGMIEINEDGELGELLADLPGEEEEIH